MELAKERRWPLTIMVFEGGIVTSLGILQELHSHLTLSCILIHTPEEVKTGLKNRVSCCPICMYVVKNNYAFLNHIIIRHYWSSFSCGKCLEFAASSGQQMKKHFPKYRGPKKVCKKGCSKGSKSSKRGTVTNLTRNQRRARKRKQTRMTSMAWIMTSFTDQLPSLLVWLLPKNKSRALRVIVDVSLDPLQVTARNQRSMARRSCMESPLRRHPMGTEVFKDAP